MHPHPLTALLLFLRRSLLACLCGCSLVSVGSADAETKSFTNSSQRVASERVTVLVRTIQATKPVKEGNSSSTEVSTELEQSLADLQPKLAQLPFRSFKLVASKEGYFEVAKKGTLNLPNGQSVGVRPIYADDHRMGMWLNWLDSDGSEILNTRLHFDCEDTIVTGTDSANDEGLLLAITASRSTVP
jgi:hypothetical protein